MSVLDRLHAGLDGPPDAGDVVDVGGDVGPVVGGRVDRRPKLTAVNCTVYSGSYIDAAPPPTISLICEARA